MSTAAATYSGPGITITVEPWGLLVRRRWRRRTRLWWEEIRGVDWPAHGQARLLLVDGELILDRGVAGLDALVALVEQAAQRARHEWRGPRLEGAKVLAWCGAWDTEVVVIEGPPTECSPVEGCLRLVALGGAGVAGCLALAALLALWQAWLASDWQGVTGSLFGLVLFGLLAVVLVMATLAGALPLPVVRERRQWCHKPQPEHEGRQQSLAITLDGLELDGAPVAWRRVREVRVEESARGQARRLVLRLDSHWASFDLPRFGCARLVHALRTLQDLSRFSFEHGDAEPPPDNALSLAHDTDATGHDRGLSLVQRERP